MRFAVISDIHGNNLALEAVLEDIARRGVTDVVNLGDCFSGPFDAARTADILLPLDLPTVAGNHDRELANTPPEDLDSIDRPTFAQLRDDHFAWLKALPPTLVYRDAVLLTHGSPRGDLDRWLDELLPDGRIVLRDYAGVEARAAGVAQSLILCGHTHEPRSIQLRDGRQIVNPGSVGVPGFVAQLPTPWTWQVGSPHARYAIIERAPSAWDITFRNVPYDGRAAAKMAIENGLPEWASALTFGWIVD